MRVLYYMCLLVELAAGGTSAACVVGWIAVMPDVVLNRCRCIIDCEFARRVGARFPQQLAIKCAWAATCSPTSDLCVLGSVSMYNCTRSAFTCAMHPPRVKSGSHRNPACAALRLMQPPSVPGAHVRTLRPLCSGTLLGAY